MKLTTHASYHFPYLFLFFYLSTSSFLPSKNLTAGIKPLIALAPAAWHSPIHYSAYLHQLQLAGYTTTSLRLPSCNSTHPASQSIAVDTDFIQQRLLMPAIDRGREVVLIMHSYSGGPGAAAAKGLSLQERRASGKNGGVIGLIFIAAFVAKEGQTLLDGSAGKFAPWVIEYVS